MSNTFSNDNFTWNITLNRAKDNLKVNELPINIKRVDKADDSGKITRGFKVQIWAGGKRVVKFLMIKNTVGARRTGSFFGIFR